MGWEQFKRNFENTFHKANQVAGDFCTAPNQEHVKDLLVHAERLTKVVKVSTDLANSAQALGQAGDKLAEASAALQGSVKVAGDVSAACEIAQAVGVLNAWTLNGSQVSAEDAAKAFDKLFGGTARYFEKVPFLKFYAAIFTEIGKDNFFSNMQKLGQSRWDKAEKASLY